MARAGVDNPIVATEVLLGRRNLWADAVACHAVCVVGLVHHTSRTARTQDVTARLCEEEKQFFSSPFWPSFPKCPSDLLGHCNVYHFLDLYFNNTTCTTAQVTCKMIFLEYLCSTYFCICLDTAPPGQDALCILILKGHIRLCTFSHPSRTPAPSRWCWSSLGRRRSAACSSCSFYISSQGRSQRYHTSLKFGRKNIFHCSFMNYYNIHVVIYLIVITLIAKIIDQMIILNNDNI